MKYSKGNGGVAINPTLKYKCWDCKGGKRSVQACRKIHTACNWQDDHRGRAGGGEDIDSHLEQPMESLGRNDTGDSDDQGHRPLADANPSDYDVVRLSVLVQEHAMVDEPSGPLWRVASEDLTTFTVLVPLGEPCKITASDLETGATFEDLSQAIEGNLSMGTRNGQDLIATFKLPLTDKDRRVHVKMRLSATANASACVVVFNVTKPVQYASDNASSSCILGPGGQSKIFELEIQPPNCKILSPAQMGEFSILPKDPKGTLCLDYENWLDPKSGRLTVSLPKMVKLPRDSHERTQRFIIKCENKRGRETVFDLVIDFVSFAFVNIPNKLIIDQSIDQAILLTSAPNILKDLQVSITDPLGLPGSGFKISHNKLEIQGMPNTTFDTEEHIVQISCHGLSTQIPVKLPLPQVLTPAPPRPTGQARITFFEHDQMIKEIKEAAAKQESYQFEEHLLDRKSLLSVGSQGCHVLTLLINIKTELHIEFDSERLSALENVNVKICRYDPITEEWRQPEDVQGLSFTVKDGNLVVVGKPIAHEDAIDVRIDKAKMLALRCIHYTTEQGRPR